MRRVTNQVTDIQFAEAVRESECKTQVLKRLGFKQNGSMSAWVSRKIRELGLSNKHFKTPPQILADLRRLPRITKTCPVCQSSFQTVSGLKKEKTVCSRSCSNTMFRSGRNNGNYIRGYPAQQEYRDICLRSHDKTCLLCGWEISIDAHHVDGNHDNNSPENLVPLCPNHHRMAHMIAYRDQIRDEIEKKQTR